MTAAVPIGAICICGRRPKFRMRVDVLPELRKRLADLDPGLVVATVECSHPQCRRLIEVTAAELYFVDGLAPAA